MSATIALPANWTEVPCPPFSEHRKLNRAARREAAKRLRKLGHRCFMRKSPNDSNLDLFVLVEPLPFPSVELSTRSFFIKKVPTTFMEVSDLNRAMARDEARVGQGWDRLVSGDVERLEALLAAFCVRATTAKHQPSGLEPLANAAVWTVRLRGDTDAPFEAFCDLVSRSEVAPEDLYKAVA